MARLLLVHHTSSPGLQAMFEAVLSGTVRYHGAGRGVAVARVLHTFGHEVIAAGLAGGSAGEMIRADLARSGIPAHFTAWSMCHRRPPRGGNVRATPLRLAP